MNYKNILLALLCLCLFSPTSIFSQGVDYGITISPALSKISYSSKPYPEFKNSLQPSGSVGFFIEKKVGENSIGMELLWTFISEKEASTDRTLITFSDNGPNELLANNLTLSPQLHYFSAPIYFRYSFGRLGLRVGLQNMFLLSSRFKYSIEGEADGEPIAYEGSDELTWVKKWDIGPKLGLDYMLSPKLTLKGEAYLGTQEINNENMTAIKGHIRQFSLGLNYTIGSF